MIVTCAHCQKVFDEFSSVNDMFVCDECKKECDTQTKTVRAEDVVTATRRIVNQEVSSLSEAVAAENKRLRHKASYQLGREERLQILCALLSSPIQHYDACTAASAVWNEFNKKEQDYDSSDN